MEEKEKKPERKTESGPTAQKLVRIQSTDISGGTTVYHGLTKIKGINWGMSSAICNALSIEKEKKVSELSQEEIKKIEEFIKSPKLPSFLLNRRRDAETGEDRHLVLTELELRKEFDIRNLKKLRTYRGLRHALGLPVRGQRTKAHFRTEATLGVQKKKAIAAQKPERKEKK